MLRPLRNYGIAVAAVLLLAACQPLGPDGKYPYYPQFADAANVPATLLPPPPQPGTKAYQKGLEAVITNQRIASEKDIEAAIAEDNITPQMITVPILGAAFTEDRYPATYSLLRRSGSDSWRIGDAARDHWKSVRPWIADSRVVLHVSPIKIPSYPSGHTLTNHVWARILADLFPQKRKVLFARADAIANHRVIAGVHYPFDLIAGITMADVTFCKMKKSPEYQQAFRAAAAEIANDPPFGTAKKNN